MSRRALRPHLVHLPFPVTPEIIQGRFSYSRSPIRTTFEANCRELSRAFPLSRGRPRLSATVRLFDAVERHSRILHQLRHSRYKVVPYLIDLAGRSAAWLRPPEDFRPRTTHGKDQLTELVRYLFESYRVPAWLRAALAPKSGRPALAPAFGWYVHVAQGQNLRNVPALPLRLSRRAAHQAQYAPARCAPLQALLYGFLRASDATPAIREALLSATRFRDFVLDESWLKLFEKIARTPEFPPDRVRPLLDYVRVRRTEGASIDVPVLALLRGMERRDADLRDLIVRKRALEYGAAFEQRWASSLPAAELEGSFEHGDYTIVELRSLRELFEEGQVMQHCVFGYAPAARSGSVSIWSLRVTRAGREVGRVTLRVIPSAREVVEARRRCNHEIHSHERELLRIWANRRGLSLMSGV